MLRYNNDECFVRSANLNAKKIFSKKICTYDFLNYLCSVLINYYTIRYD